jgi:hypothetical protein
MTEQKPSVGRIVHYVSHGTPVQPDGSQAYTAECRAAIVTEVPPDDAVALCVLNPTGMFFNRALYDGSEQPEGGSWHWPERV